MILAEDCSLRPRTDKHSLMIASTPKTRLPGPAHPIWCPLPLRYGGTLTSGIPAWHTCLAQGEAGSSNVLMALASSTPTLGREM